MPTTAKEILEEFELTCAGLPIERNGLSGAFVIKAMRAAVEAVRPHEYVMPGDEIHICKRIMNYYENYKNDKARFFGEEEKV